MSRNHKWVYPIELVRVIDGDTIDVRIDLGFGIYMAERVRLAHIDAPEVRTRDLEEKERGLAAKEFLENTLQHAIDSGKSLYLDSREFDTTGKYGRTLGVILVESASINQLLLDEGHAVPYTK